MTAKQYEKLYVAARNKWPVLTHSAMREIKKAYADAAEKISAQLRAAAASGKSQLTIDMLADLQAQLMSASESVAAALQKEVPATVSAGYYLYAPIDTAMTAKLVGDTVTKAGLEAMTVSINNRLIANLLNRTLQDGYTFSERVWQTGADYQIQIKRLLASGTAQGRGTAKIARDLGDYVKKGRASLPKGYTEAKFGDVVVKNVDYRALRVVRTELGTSMQEAAIEQSWSNPAATQLFNWVRINTQVHECVCPDLAAGSPYKAPGAPLDRPDVPARPHPNCMCQIRPILMDLDTVADDIARWHNGEQVGYLDEWYARYRRTA
jgi:hypothetical protein